MKVKDIAKKYGDYEIDENELNKLLVKPKPNSICDLKDGDEYFYIGTTGIIYSGIWKNTPLDLYRLSMGNVFLTYDEAEFELERRKVETELLKYGGTRKFNYSTCNHSIIYDYNTDDICIYGNTYSFIQYPCVIYFKNRKDCENAINTIGEDRIKKYIFNVK